MQANNIIFDLCSNFRHNLLQIRKCEQDPTSQEFIKTYFQNLIFFADITPKKKDLQWNINKYDKEQKIFSQIPL
jgi:hypothetical protein